MFSLLLPVCRACHVTVVFRADARSEKKRRLYGLNHLWLFLLRFSGCYFHSILVSGAMYTNYNYKYYIFLYLNTCDFPYSSFPTDPTPHGPLLRTCANLTVLPISVRCNPVIPSETDSRPDNRPVTDNRPVIRLKRKFGELWRLIPPRVAAAYGFWVLFVSETEIGYKYWDLFTESKFWNSYGF